MPSVVESRRIYAEARKKRQELDLDYRLGRHAAPQPDPVNLRSLRCISQIVLEATKETKQAKHFVELMGVDVNRFDEGDLIDMCSPMHAYQAIRIREALLQLAELRRILRERMGQANILPEEDKMRKILLQEMQNLRKALSTSHLGRNIEGVETSLNNLRHILDNFTFSDEVQEYTRKAALAVAQIQGIKISHPLMKALAQQYSSKHGSLEEAGASPVPMWKKGAWRHGGAKKEEPVSKASHEKEPMGRGPSLTREEVDLQEMFQAEDEQEAEAEGLEGLELPRKARKKRRSSTSKGKTDGKRRNSRSQVEEIVRDPAFEVDPLPKRRSSVTKGKGLPGRAKRSEARRQSFGDPKETSSQSQSGFTFRKNEREAVAQEGSASGFLGSELPTSVAARKPHGQPPSPAGASSGSATASATPGSSPVTRAADTPQSPAARTPGSMSARVERFVRPGTSPGQPPHSARGGHNSEPLQRTRVTHHLPPEILRKQSTEVDMGSTLPFQEAQVADLLPLPTQPSGPTEPVGPTAPGPTGPGPGPQNLEALKVPLEEAKALRVNTVDSAEESTELANFLGFMGASMDSTSFQKDGSQDVNAPERVTSGRFLVGSEALIEDAFATSASVARRPSTEGSYEQRSRGIQKRVSWAPLMRSAKEEKKLPMTPLITRVNTGPLPRPSLPRRPTTSNLESLQKGLDEDEEQIEEPPAAVAVKPSQVAMVQRPLMLPSGWSKQPDKARNFSAPAVPFPQPRHLLAASPPEVPLPWMSGEAHPMDLGTSSKEIVDQFCTQDIHEWCAQEEMLNSLFSPTPEPSDPGDAGQDAADACDAWDLGQEQSTISFVSRSISCSSASEDEQEFLRELQGPGFFEAHGREPPHMSSTGGLPQIVDFLPPVSSPRQARDDDRVCIETVLAYRTKRGFREQPVVPEWQEKYDSKLMEISQCGTGHMPCFCRRCLMYRLPMMN